MRGGSALEVRMGLPSEGGRASLGKGGEGDNPKPSEGRKGEH